MEIGNKIAKEDVVSVATSIGVTLTDDEIEDIVENYPYMQEMDPTGTWDLVVDDMINFILLHRHEN